MSLGRRLAITSTATEHQNHGTSHTLIDMSLHYLFGGESPWDLKAWTDSDDRVRGGKSQSYLTASPEGARFHGNLDITALGGAGFASQRTVGILNLNVSEYDGLVLAVAEADADKRFTLTLKDEVLPKRDDGRDQSSISWEYDFTATPGRDVVIRWSDLKPTYRGRPKPDAKPLDTAGIKRVSFMMRSFFGDQQGDFSLVIRHVAAFSGRPATSTTAGSIRKESNDVARPAKARSQWRSLFCGLF